MNARKRGGTKPGPWHEYLSRCQYMLRQGLFVADLCYLSPSRKDSAQRSRLGTPPDRPGYDFDICSPDVLFSRMAVRDGRIVLPDGMSYRLLVLPESKP